MRRRRLWTLAVVAAMAAAVLPAAPATAVAPTKTIMEIQGKGLFSPLTGQTVQTSGIVTAITDNGRDAWIQDPIGDGIDNSSDGIFIDDFDSLFPTPAIGDLITVEGEVEDTQFGAALPRTRLDDTVLISIDSTGNKLPAPVVLDDLPDFGLNNGITFWENLEGMRVKVDKGRVVAPTSQFGEFAVLAKADRAPGSGFIKGIKQILLRGFGDNKVDYNPERILVDDATLPGPIVVQPGDKITVIGVVDYTFGAYKIEPTRWFANTKFIPPDPVSERNGPMGDTRITTYNVENLFDTVDNPGKADSPADPLDLEIQLTKLALAIETELELPDILVVQEVENQDILQELGDRVNASAGTDYVATSFETSDARGIEVGFLWDANRVALDDAFQVTEAMVPGTDAAFGEPPLSPSGGREPLVGVFDIGGRFVVIIGNHFKSKSGDDPPFGVNDPFIRVTETQRKAQAQVVRDMANLIFDDQGDDVMMMITGDLNDFQFGEPGEGTDHPVAILEGTAGEVPFVNLIETHEKFKERWSFIFDGNSQVLDHMLVNPALFEAVAGADYLHFNAAYPAYLHDDPSTTLRASDHDAFEGRFELRSDVELQILAINDFHGNIATSSSSFGGTGRADFLATNIAAREAEVDNSIFVSAGDLIGASPLVSGLFHDEPTIEIMNMLGLDLNGVGNHEFDEGPDELLRMQFGGTHPVDGDFGGDVFAGADFEFLSANVEVDATTETLFAPYAIRWFEGFPVAFVGMTLEATPSIVTAAGTAGLSFFDEADTVNDLVPELEAQGIEAIVVLLHEGGSSDGGPQDCGTGLEGPIADAVAAMDEAVDLVIAGHTNDEFVCEINDIWVTMADNRGRLFTDIDVTLDAATGDLVVVQIENVSNLQGGVTPDPDVTDEIEFWEALAAPLADVVIGTVTADILRAPNDAGESALGDVIADAQLESTTGLGSVVAFMNPGGIRDDVRFTAEGSEADGEFTFGEAFGVQPFNNDLWTMLLTGAQIDTLLEQQWEGQTSPRILQVSEDFTYEWSESAPDGAKVDIASIMIDGVAVDAETTYRVTVNNFMAGGGDNFFVLLEGTDIEVGQVDLDALVDYFGANSPVAPGPQDRIVKIA